MVARVAGMVAVLTVAAVFSGCSSAPSKDGSCGDEGEFLCDPDNSQYGFECVKGTWREIPCRDFTSVPSHLNPVGCRKDTIEMICTTRDVSPGDPCWTHHEGREQCLGPSSLTRDPDIKIVCRAGVWEKETCVGCAIKNYKLACD